MFEREKLANVFDIIARSTRRRSSCSSFEVEPPGSTKARLRLLSRRLRTCNFEKSIQEESHMLDRKQKTRCRREAKCERTPRGKRICAPARVTPARRLHTRLANSASPLGIEPADVDENVLARVVDAARARGHGTP